MVFSRCRQFFPPEFSGVTFLSVQTIKFCAPQKGLAGLTRNAELLLKLQLLQG